VIVDINGKVLLTGSATGGTTYSGTYNSSAYIQIDNSSGVTKDYFSYSDDQSTPVDINITNKQLVISTDKMFTIMLEVSAQAGAGCGGCSAIASAIIDPTTTIDPTNVDADEYSLGFSDGLTTTPLPSTWFLLLSGLAGLAFFAYRGTKNGSAAIAAA
jgi:hypothetical protein